MSNKLKISVLLSSYNYIDYIGETIDSVLSQTRPVDEIIIVDDGSTDGSLEFLYSKYIDSPSIKIISKNNNGQLSALNEAFLRSTGDIICFLDSDDQYESNYLEEIEKIYLKNKEIQYISCAYREFGNRTGVVSRYRGNADLGITPLGVFFENIWTSGPTATISARKSILEKFFPIPFESDWVISPDACISWGASLVGARKYFLAQPLIKYRIHDKNAHVVVRQERYPSLLKKYKFMNYVLKINEINIYYMTFYVCDEFYTIKNVEVKRAFMSEYLKIIFRSDQLLKWKIISIFRVIAMAMRR